MTQPALDLVIAALEKIREPSDRAPRASRSLLAQLQTAPRVAASLWEARASSARRRLQPTPNKAELLEPVRERVRAWRSCGGRPAWNARDHAGTARPLACLQRHPAHDYVSPCLLAPKPGAFGKTQSLGRHAASAGATRTTDHRATAKLFFVSAREDRIDRTPRCESKG